MLIIKKLRKKVNQCALKPAMYRPYIPTYPRNIEKMEKRT